MNLTLLRRLIVAGALAALGLPMAATAQPGRLTAPNLTVISDRLVTSGQPSGLALAMLGAQGFGAVIYLAPLDVEGAVNNEPAIVERQGLKFINIPIRFNNPTEKDFDAFEAAMTALPDQKVLVHCQVNMRASSIVFLHRVITNHEDPDRAYEAVAKVWSPDGPWKKFIVAMLRQHGVAFEPY